MATDKFHRMTIADLKQLYQGGVLMYASCVVQVGQIRSQREMEIYDLETGCEHTVLIDPRLIKPLPRSIGYYNSELYNGAVFVNRLPARRYSLGLVAGANTRLSSSWGGAVGTLCDKGVVKALRNEYPKLEEAQAQAAREGRPVAFTQHFAVHPGGRLLFRNRPIGAVVGGKITLLDNYKHVRAFLEMEYEGA